MIVFIFGGIYFVYLWLVFRGSACLWCGGRFDGQCRCGRPR